MGTPPSLSLSYSSYFLTSMKWKINQKKKKEKEKKRAEGPNKDPSQGPTSFRRRETNRRGAFELRSAPSENRAAAGGEGGAYPGGGATARPSQRNRQFPNLPVEIHGLI